MANYGNIYPFQQDLLANPLWANLMMALMGGMLAVYVCWSIYEIIRHKNWVPLLLSAGVFVLSWNEGTLDVALHLSWAANVPAAWWQYGQPVPLFIVCAYMSIIPALAYTAYTKMKKGITTKQFFCMWAVYFVAVALAELPATATGVYVYQGNQPLNVLGYPLYNAWINSSGICLVAAALFVFMPMLKGWKVSLVTLLPVFAFTATWGTTAWPIYASLNWSGISAIPVIAQWLLTFVSLTMALILSRTTAGIVCVDSKWTWRVPVRQEENLSTSPR